MSKANDGSRVRFWIDKTGFFAESAIYFLFLAAVFRVIGCWGLWKGNRVELIMQIALPVCCCLLLALCIILLGKKGFFLSFIPVLLGVVFFVYKSLQFTSWIHTILCILLYMVVAVVYTATVFGWIRTKWLLPPLFGLPFIYHIVVEDLPALAQGADNVKFSAGVQEMSVLCIMAALFCIGMGLKKRPTEPAVIEAEPVEPMLDKDAPAEAAAPADGSEPAEAEPSPAETGPAPVEAAPMDGVPADEGFAPVDEAYFEPSGDMPVLTLDPVVDEAAPQEKEHEQ